MGMFDSFYDAKGNEWQTKALACLLDSYRAGDTVPSAPLTHQMKVIGDHRLPDPWAYATIRDGCLESVPDKRDIRLPLLDYNGGWIAVGKGDIA